MNACLFVHLLICVLYLYSFLCGSCALINFRMFVILLFVISCADVSALVVVISHVDQIDDIFFGHEGVLKGVY